VSYTKEHEFITLSDRDRKVFMEALLNPPDPNPKLREAFAKVSKLNLSRND